MGPAVLEAPEARGPNLPTKGPNMGILFERELACTRRERLIILANLLAAHERASGLAKWLLAREIDQVTALSRPCITPPPGAPPGCPQDTALPGLPPIPPAPSVGSPERLTAAPPRGLR